MDIVNALIGTVAGYDIEIQYDNREWGLIRSGVLMKTQAVGLERFLRDWTGMTVEFVKIIVQYDPELITTWAARIQKRSTIVDHNHALVWTAPILDSPTFALALFRFVSDTLPFNVGCMDSKGNVTMLSVCGIQVADASHDGIVGGKPLANLEGAYFSFVPRNENECLIASSSLPEGSVLDAAGKIVQAEMDGLYLPIFTSERTEVVCAICKELHVGMCVSRWGYGKEDDETDQKGERKQTENETDGTESKSVKYYVVAKPAPFVTTQSGVILHPLPSICISPKAKLFWAMPEPGMF
jgi:hypothetical protein